MQRHRLSIFPLLVPDFGGSVHQDSSQPGLYRSASAETFEALESRHKSFLADVFGVGPAGGKRKRHAKQLRRMSIHQDVKRPVIAFRRRLP